jgi:hypothetical protein
VNADTPVRLSPEREAEIAARAEAATSGPWEANARIGIVTNKVGDPLAVFGGGAQDRADAEFTAHAREDVPALLAELAAVRAERDQAQACVASVVEYGVRVPGASWPEDGVLRDGDTFDRADQEARLERVRDSWPNAELVQRGVRYGKWTESVR